MQKQSTKCRNINGKIGLRVPRTVLVEKGNRYKKQGRVMHRNKLLNESDYTILATYQLAFRGIANYSRLAYNLHTLQLLKGVMEQSLAMTLARKHKTSVRKIMNQYKAELVVDGQIYKGLQVRVPREGKKPKVGHLGRHPPEVGDHSTYPGETTTPVTALEQPIRARKTTSRASL
jgi:hypothetical protein